MRPSRRRGLSHTWTMANTPALFQPIRLRDVQVRNRIWIPPMCQYSVPGPDGMPNDWHLMHYGSFARGGAGLVTVEATSVTPEGRISAQDLGLWNDQQRDAFRAVTNLIHSQGATAAVQLAHAGRKASTRRSFPGEPAGVATEDEGGWAVVAPSPIPFPGLAHPTELTDDGIAAITGAFASAARRAADAGFDVLEIHGAHGYLLHEFLSPISNQRTDRYGGPLENRARFLLQVTQAVREAVGGDVPIIVRLSATEWTTGGFSTEDTIEVSLWLKERGVDLISVSSGGNVPQAPIPIGPGYQVPLATAIRNKADIPVAVAGLITEPAQAEQIVALHEADAVYIGREALRDPNFAVRAARALRFDGAYIPLQYRRAHL